MRLHKAEQFILLDAKLPKILSGEILPADAAESLALAELCQLSCRQLYDAATRLYRDAFAAEPRLAENFATESRYNAACAAALAGCGQGKDAANLEPGEHARLRRQSLAWLRAELGAWQTEKTQNPQKECDRLDRSIYFGVPARG